MSESTSAPAAPAGGDSAPPSSPPAASQPGISVSEAGRLLSKQRRPNGEAAAAPAPERQPPARDLAKAFQPANPAAPAAPPAPVKEMSALDKAMAAPGTTPAPAPAPPPSTTPPEVTSGVEIEGKRYTQAELREFISKGNDYTQKTQALADQTRQLREQQQALAAVLPYIQPELQKLAQTVGQQAQRPDPALLETDPQGYLRARAAYEQALDEQQRLTGLSTMQQQAHARALEQQVAQAHEQLVKDFPFWADPVERGKAQQEIITWATGQGGYSRDQLHNLSDPTILKTMMKARAYDNLMSGAKTTAPVARVGAPVRGAAPPPPASERVTQAEESFSAKPDIRNAAALLAARRAR